MVAPDSSFSKAVDTEADSSGFDRNFTIENLGFFRFVENLAAPIQELTTAIDREIVSKKAADPDWDIKRSLIVLPEAFNLGRPYERSDASPSVEAKAMLHALRFDIAQHHSVALIVGLLEEKPGRRNSAYWIDAEGETLMCHKVDEDETGLYRPCRDINPDRLNPILCHNAQVGALICLDAFTECHSCVQQRRRLLRARLNHENKIVGVCAQTTLYGPNRHAPTDAEGCWYVVADGNYNGESLVLPPDDRTRGG